MGPSVHQEQRGGEDRARDVPSSGWYHCEATAWTEDSTAFEKRRMRRRGAEWKGWLHCTKIPDRIHRIASTFHRPTIDSLAYLSRRTSSRVARQCVRRLGEALALQGEEHVHKE